MMSLYDKLIALYPELQMADFVSTIRLQNDSDGRGDYIAEWNHPTLPEPTDEQLEQAQPVAAIAEVTNMERSSSYD